MSYAAADGLQTAIYNAIATDLTLIGLVDNNVFDAVPVGRVPETYVSLGDERVQQASDQSADGAIHQLEIYVRTKLPGFAKAKQVAAAVSDALHDANLVLARGRLVFLRFERAQARRVEENSTREIVLRFRARVDDL